MTLYVFLTVMRLIILKHVNPLWQVSWALPTLKKSPPIPTGLHSNDHYLMTRPIYGDLQDVVQSGQHFTMSYFKTTTDSAFS